MDRKIINTDLSPEDAQIEKTLRPSYLSEYVGQEKIKNNLKFKDYLRTGNRKAGRYGCYT